MRLGSLSPVDPAVSLTAASGPRYGPIAMNIDGFVLDLDTYAS